MGEASSSDTDSDHGHGESVLQQTDGSPASKIVGPQAYALPAIQKALEMLLMQGANAEAAEHALKATADHQPSDAARSAAVEMLCCGSVFSSLL